MSLDIDCVITLIFVEAMVVVVASSAELVSCSFDGRSEICVLLSEIEMVRVLKSSQAFWGDLDGWFVCSFGSWESAKKVVTAVSYLDVLCRVSSDSQNVLELNS